MQEPVASVLSLHLLHLTLEERFWCHDEGRQQSCTCFPFQYMSQYSCSLHCPFRLQEMTRLVSSLQPAKLAASALSVNLLTVLLHSLLSLSDTVEHPAALLTALATALPYILDSGPAQRTPDLVKCYSLTSQLCFAADLASDSQLDTDDESQGGVLRKDLGSILGASVMEGLQSHLSREFVQPRSTRLTNISLEGLWEVLQLLDQYQVPLSESFWAACTSICNQCVERGARSVFRSS